MEKGIDSLIKLALKEDIGKKDLTTEFLIPRDKKVKANIIAKENGVIAGLKVAEKVFKICNMQYGIWNTGNGIKFRRKIKDGEKVKKGLVVAEISGPARTILTAERVALNFLQHLSGIATLTRKYVDALVPRPSSHFPLPKIYDTRKTTPLWRELEKYAVRCGGGYNHRMNLGEMVLIKDNHLRIIKNSKFKIKNLRKELPRNIKIEMEAQNLEQVRQALNAGVDIIMLDNMLFPEIKKAIKMIRKTQNAKRKTKPGIEISGGVNLKNIKKIAQLGVERISVGEITHSAPALDISLEIRR